MWNPCQQCSTTHTLINAGLSDKPRKKTSIYAALKIYPMLLHMTKRIRCCLMTGSASTVCFCWFIATYWANMILPHDWAQRFLQQAKTFAETFLLCRESSIFPLVFFFKLCPQEASFEILRSFNWAMPDWKQHNVSEFNGTCTRLIQNPFFDFCGVFKEANFNIAVFRNWLISHMSLSTLSLKTETEDQIVLVCGTN